MEWKKGKIIGKGATATVSLASSLTGNLFAVKSTELSSSSFLQNEKELLSQLNSPYIVQYMGHEITEENDTQVYNMFMEYVPCGSLSDFIKKNKGSLNEPMIKVFAKQILLGLEYLHSNGIVHCDIKGGNVLIAKDGVKIADLGSAKAVSTSAFSGTPAYMAPEVARGEEQSFSADVWALGCTVIEMVTGSHPFPNEENPVSVLYSVGFSQFTPEIPMGLSGKGKDFLGKCLERDSKLRLSAKELLGHPFFDDLISTPLNFDEFTRVSPTSVLEQGFWDSVEGPESRESTVHFSSGTERIKGLFGESNSSSPNWDFDEDWISVRINESEENIQDEVVDQIEEIFVDQLQVFGSLDYDTIDTVVEYSNDLAVFLDDFSVLRETELMLCEIVLDDIFYVSLDLEKKLMRNSIIVQFNCFETSNISLSSDVSLFLTLQNLALKNYESVMLKAYLLMLIITIEVFIFEENVS